MASTTKLQNRFDIAGGMGRGVPPHLLVDTKWRDTYNFRHMSKLITLIPRKLLIQTLTLPSVPSDPGTLECGPVSVPVSTSTTTTPTTTTTTTTFNTSPTTSTPATLPGTTTTPTTPTTTTTTTTGPTTTTATTTPGSTTTTTTGATTPTTTTTTTPLPPTTTTTTTTPTTTTTTTTPLPSSLACDWFANPVDFYFDSAEHDDHVDVTTWLGCSWTAESNDSWIQITGGAFSLGSATTTFHVDANASGARVGTISLKTSILTSTYGPAGTVFATVTINQSAPTTTTTTTTTTTLPLVRLVVSGGPIVIYGPSNLPAYGYSAYCEANPSQEGRTLLENLSPPGGILEWYVLDTALPCQSYFYGYGPGLARLVRYAADPTYYQLELTGPVESWYGKRLVADGITGTYNKVYAGNSPNFLTVGYYP